MMKKLLILMVLMIFLAGCTGVSLVNKTKEKVSEEVEERIEPVKEKVENKTSIITETIEKITDTPYDTPTIVSKRILKEIEVDDFGDVI